jgi:septal ring factor EnvC (AmiA/AmiB activator)
MRRFLALPRAWRLTAARQAASNGLALLFAATLLFLPPHTVSASAAESQRAELETVRSRIDGLRAQMQSISEDKSEWVGQLQQTEQQIGRLARKLRVLEGQLQRQREELERLGREREAQAQALAEQRKALARQVRAAYAMGRQERLKILLNQQDPATVGRIMTYYDYLGRARAAKMQAIRGQLQALADTEQRIFDEERELHSLRERQQSELAALERSQAQRRDVIARLTLELTDQGEQLDRLQSDEQQLEMLITGIEQALADIPVGDMAEIAFAGRRGQLPWPARGRVLNRFGAQRLGGLVWDGVIIAAPEGQEVLAVHHGRVAFADWLRGFGLLLIVDHGDGYMTLYGHNQSLFKEVGDWVDAGEPVALVGSSGGRDQAGVYFGIRHEGRAVDPARWCLRPRGRNVG